MGWSWDDYQGAPAALVDDLKAYLNAKSAVAARETRIATAIAQTQGT